MGLDTCKHPTWASLHVGENNDHLVGTSQSVSSSFHWMPPFMYWSLLTHLSCDWTTSNKRLVGLTRVFTQYNRANLFIQKKPTSLPTHTIVFFRLVGHYSPTLCWTRPYSRWGRSQKRKFCFLHSALKEGPFAEPNISSRKACEKDNTQYALWLVCSPVSRPPIRGSQASPVFTFHLHSQ